MNDQIYERFYIENEYFTFSHKLVHRVRNHRFGVAATLIGGKKATVRASLRTVGVENDNPIPFRKNCDATGRK